MNKRVAKLWIFRNKKYARIFLFLFNRWRLSGNFSRLI